ncbi:MAG: hypothetical protein EBZ50_03720, partial [Alphaproteobacteria bacterium]|nr:hypothetical protein [Alphaproteobacteria bacterium]
HSLPQVLERFGRFLAPHLVKVAGRNIDPTWRTPLTDPGARLAAAEGLLTWRAQHLDRTMTGMLVEDGGIGRWPPMDGTWKTERTS